MPLTNASITDAVFEVEKSATAAEVNDLLRAAAGSDLKGILQARSRAPLQRCMWSAAHVFFGGAHVHRDAFCASTVHHKRQM